MKAHWVLFFLALILCTGLAYVACGGGGDDDDDRDTGDDDVDDDDDDTSASDAIRVPADDADGVATGITVASGDTLIVQATGTVYLDAENTSATPDGAGIACGPDCPFPDAALGALIGAIGEGDAKAATDCTLMLGASFAGSAPCDGALTLLVNDFDYTDNSDFFEATASAGDDDDDVGATWTDATSGLMWQNGDECCFDWEEAVAYCEGLNWGGQNDWRLPTISELRSFIRGCAGTETGGSCGVTDDCLSWDDCLHNCYGCQDQGGPGPDGRYWPDGLYGDGTLSWSSSAVYGDGWYVNFEDASIYFTHHNYNNLSARCVR